LSWTAYIDYVRPDGITTDRYPLGPLNLSGTSSTYPLVDIDLGGIVQGGTIHFNVDIYVRDVLTDVPLTISGSPNLEILGINPDKAAVKSRLGNLALQVIAYKESTFLQFGENGLPLVGLPLAGA
jgi:hypothetical protein